MLGMLPNAVSPMSVGFRRDHVTQASVPTQVSKTLQKSRILFQSQSQVTYPGVIIIIININIIIMFTIPVNGAV